MYIYGWGGRVKGKHELHIHSIKAHRTSRLTRRDEGVLDCIALDEVAPYAVHTLNDVSVKSLHRDLVGARCCQGLWEEEEGEARSGRGSFVGRLKEKGRTST